MESGAYVNGSNGNTKWQQFFSTPSKYSGAPNEIDQLKAYENAESNFERLEILFHLPIVQVG